MVKASRWSIRGIAAAGCMGLALLAHGCGDGTSPPEPLPPVVLMGASPPAQTGEVGGTVFGPLVFVMEEDSLTRVRGVIVNFTLTGNGTISRSADTTDASGRAQVETWTLGNSPGTSTITTTSPRVPGAAVVFTAEARAAASAGDVR